MSEQKKPGFGFWATVVATVLVLYPLSFGPACWIVSRYVGMSEVLSIVYRPLVCVVVEFPDSTTATLIRRYASWMAMNGPVFGRARVPDGEAIISFSPVTGPFSAFIFEDSIKMKRRP